MIARLSWLSLSRLLASGRPENYPVLHNGTRFVPWLEFSTGIEARTAFFAKRQETRWILHHDSPHTFAIDFFALLHAGKQVVIPPNARSETVRQLSVATNAAVTTMTTSFDGPKKPPRHLDAGAQSIDIYTSGSTGEPKRIRKSLTQFETEIRTLESLWGRILGDTTIIATVPHLHIYGLLFRLLWPLAAGRPFDNITCSEPDTLRNRLVIFSRNGSCALVSSPAQLSRIPQLVPLTALQPPPVAIFSSGGPLRADIANVFHRELNLVPIEIYGSTETGGIAWRCQDGSATADAWTPLSGINVAADIDGALLLTSNFSSQQDQYRMNDAISLLSDGRFHLHGRLDRVVKVEEKRLSLPDLENCLMRHPWIQDAAATVLQGRRQSLGAALVLNSTGREQLALQGRLAVVRTLREHLADHFEPVLLPRRWRFPPGLPLNERGKLTQEALDRLFNISGTPHAPA